MCSEINFFQKCPFSNEGGRGEKISKNFPNQNVPFYGRGEGLIKIGTKSLSLLSFFEVVPKATLLSNFYGQNIEYKHNIYVKIIYFSHLFSTKTRSNFPLQINPLGKPSETRTTNVVRNAGCTHSRYTHSEFFFNQLMNE